MQCHDADVYLSQYQCENLWTLHYVADITDRMDFIKQKLWLPPPQIGSLSPGFQATCVQIMVNVGDNWWGWVIADIQDTGSFVWMERETEKHRVILLDPAEFRAMFRAVMEPSLCWSWVVAICCSLLVVLLHFPPAKRRHPGKVNMHWGGKVTNTFLVLWYRSQGSGTIFLTCFGICTLP